MSQEDKPFAPKCVCGADAFYDMMDHSWVCGDCQDYADQCQCQRKEES